MFRINITLAIFLVLQGCASSGPTDEAIYLASQDESYWTEMKRRNTTDSYDSYLSKYPTGEFVSLAHKGNGDLYLADKKLWNDAKSINSDSSYNNYLSIYPTGYFTSKAYAAKKQLIREAQRIKDEYEATQIKKTQDALTAKQSCKLKESNWIYLSNACSGNYAHGIGKAQTFTGLTFIGTFDNGFRIKGEILAGGELKYDGTLKGGKPHGEGVCMHKGEPEACKYYKGKRIDVLYKQRIEFAIQSEKFEQQQQLLSKQQQDILASQKELSNERRNSTYANNGAGSTNTGDNVLVKAIKRKAADKAADMLFDQLF
ncbi:MAG: hypothetical protein V7785_20285 [Bermanella sp.]